MRLWHYKLLPYLPDAQFRGQLRELVAIMHDWRDKGKTNHLLVNRVMEYDQSDLYSYYVLYHNLYQDRYKKPMKPETMIEFNNFAGYRFVSHPFQRWHNTEYLRVCMANLYEKHRFGIGKSRITDEEWNRLLYGYKRITGEEYVI